VVLLLYLVYLPVVLFSTLLQRLFLVIIQHSFMADAVDVNDVNDIVRRAVQGINVNNHAQALEIQCPEYPDGQQQPPLTLTTGGRDVQYFVDLLQRRHMPAVNKLELK
jgi:hypothetical protein